jgi:hypothetical protein
MTPDHEAAARDTTVWWPGEKLARIEDAVSAPYHPGPLAWFLTVIAAVLMGAAGVVWFPL